MKLRRLPLLSHSHSTSGLVSTVLNESPFLLHRRSHSLKGAIPWSRYKDGHIPGTESSHSWSYHGSASGTGTVTVTPGVAGDYFIVLSPAESLYRATPLTGIR